MGIGYPSLVCQVYNYDIWMLPFNDISGIKDDGYEIMISYTCLEIYFLIHLRQKQTHT